ncbi:uncharacterized protein SAMN02745781_03026 [Vibrio gazogenes DSM 21264]|uniref:YecA family protein n=1 Tax=Vibrio gazogenes DSM 21264 = NBRC 103151 TaxID=1123492 RepID=A0A1M5DYU2_VIBGA|nr:uncharacterized protein SAMN02745781_03026 [Vibrio gazogenes DSM 21264] [Vibrio gazogenes DSM 21264 = NBRC 103151]SJN54327.1 hypothetical protein BQ6471_00952 [Vibrio gazogenes]
MNVTLTEIIASVEQPEQLLNEHQMTGFIVALAAAPYLISPEEWLSYLWGGSDVAPFAESSHLEMYCQHVVQHWNTARESLLSGSWQWPASCLLDDEEIVNQATRDFCEGMLQGWQLTKDDWETLMPPETENGALLGGVLLSITMLYDPETSLVTLNEAGADAMAQFEEIYQAVPVMLSGLSQRTLAIAESDD